MTMLERGTTLEKLGEDLVDLRIRELGRRTSGFALPALACCSSSSSCSGSLKKD
jgi:hypothetical protein